MAFTLTETAAKKISDLFQKEPDSNGLVFRIMVSGGGCSGFQYEFSLDKDRRDDDHFFENYGVTVAIDEASLPFLKDAQLEYVEDMIGSSFQVKNPDARSSCGCGNSFSV